MKKYKFLVKVKENYTTFDYNIATTHTKKYKTVRAGTQKEAIKKIKEYLKSYGIFSKFSIKPLTDCDNKNQEKRHERIKYTRQGDTGVFENY